MIIILFQPSQPAHFMFACPCSLTGALLLQSSFLMVVRMATRLHVLPSSLPTHIHTQVRRMHRLTLRSTSRHTEALRAKHYLHNITFWQQNTLKCEFKRTQRKAHTHSLVNICPHTNTHFDHFTAETCHSHNPEMHIEQGSLLPSSRSLLWLTVGWQGGTVLTAEIWLSYWLLT